MGVCGFFYLVVFVVVFGFVGLFVFLVGFFWLSLDCSSFCNKPGIGLVSTHTAAGVFIGPHFITARCQQVDTLPVDTLVPSKCLVITDFPCGPCV